MKSLWTIFQFALLSVCAVAGRGEVVVTSGDPYTGGIAYRWTLSGMDASDQASLVSHVELSASVIPSIF